MYKGNYITYGGTINPEGSKITDAVCDHLGWSPINALKTMVRGNIIYVRGTVLKPSEVASFGRINGATIDGRTCKQVNFL